jgi:hypothetical protein
MAQMRPRTIMHSFSYNSQIKCFQAHVITDMFSLFWYMEFVPQFLLKFQSQPVFLKYMPKDLIITGIIGTRVLKP